MKFDNLLDKNILVTGATSGIGKCLTLKLIENGANVAFCGRSADKMTKLLSEIIGSKSNNFYKVFDVTNEDEIITFVGEATSNIGVFDVLVNCAGANTSRSSVSNIKTIDLEYMLKLNTIAPFVSMREVYKNIESVKRGTIINVLSTVCNFSNEGIGAYTASKASLDALAKVFRKEARLSNVKVCSIYPGGVNTSFRETTKPEYLEVESVVQAICTMILTDSNTSIDELVIRPMIEKNYI
jgi:NADP-dependent 3-hydroxy acid dehydrogenase YdfG